MPVVISTSNIPLKTPIDNRPIRATSWRASWIAGERASARGKEACHTPQLYGLRLSINSPQKLDKLVALTVQRIQLSGKAVG